GRTGRAGKSGIAMSFVIPREYRQLRLIEKMINTRIKREKLPSLADIFEHRKDQITERLVNIIEEGQMDHYYSIVENLADEYNTMDIAAAALKIALDLEDPREEREEHSETDFGDTGAEPGMVRLFMNIGREDEMRPQDIVRTIAEEAGIQGKTIGAIRIFDRFTFVEVPREAAERVMYSLDKNTIKGKRVHVEPAKRRNR
ncbi:ATP-dependent helicase, partial [bacterium]